MKLQFMDVARNMKKGAENQNFLTTPTNKISAHDFYSMCTYMYIHNCDVTENRQKG